MSHRYSHLKPQRHFRKVLNKYRSLFKVDHLYWIHFDPFWSIDVVPDTEMFPVLSHNHITTRNPLNNTNIQYHGAQLNLLWVHAIYFILYLSNSVQMLSKTCFTNKFLPIQLRFEAIGITSQSPLET